MCKKKNGFQKISSFCALPDDKHSQKLELKASDEDRSLCFTPPGGVGHGCFAPRSEFGACRHPSRRQGWFHLQIERLHGKARMGSLPLTNADHKLLTLASPGPVLCERIEDLTSQKRKVPMGLRTQGMPMVAVRVWDIVGWRRRQSVAQTHVTHTPSLTQHTHTHTQHTHCTCTLKISGGKGFPGAGSKKGRKFVTLNKMFLQIIVKISTIFKK